MNGGMWVVALVLGVSFGCGLAATRVPRINPAALTAGLVGTVVIAVALLTLGNFAAAAVFAVSCPISSSLFAGFLWARAAPDDSRGYWRWVGNDLVHPGYLRKEHRAESEELSS